MRPDFYYRVKSVELRLPPLRERSADLPLLVETFSRRLQREDAGPAFSDAALRALASYSWPGNVRELSNVVTRLALTEAPVIDAAAVERVLRATPVDGAFPCSLLRSRPLRELLAAAFPKKNGRGA